MTYRDGDEFARAELDDYRLELAADRELQRDDWFELHDVPVARPSIEEALAEWGRQRREANRE